MHESLKFATIIRRQLLSQSSAVVLLPCLRLVLSHLARHVPR
jgi:hypothetical protein